MEIIIDIEYMNLENKEIIAMYEGKIIRYNNNFFLVGSDTIIKLPPKHFSEFTKNIGMQQIRLKNISNELKRAKERIGNLSAHIQKNKRGIS